MDERAARRPNLELVRKDVQLTSSGLVPTTPAGAITASLGIATGVLLDGKYLVGRIIGAGAVGIVFEAKNVELDETVALKCLRPEMLIDPGVVARFAREAKAAAAIKSEYVATVHDVGMTDDGVPFIVMEYLEGKDLGTVVADSGTLSPRSAVEYALHVCEALAVAHSKGIVHRDIKPENLLLTERAGGMRIVKVLDFGISKTALTGSIFQNELPLVKTVNLMGTPLYMSPEQVRVSDSVDVRSDIWSLGMVIYEILTGQTAFAGQSITEICAAILEASPQPIERYRSDLPSGLVEVISKCLQKDVDKRFQNIAELALALAPFGPKRTRLNVERAVAVLQASGHFDPAVRVNSTVPPSPGDFLGQLSIPRAPAVPTTSGIVPAPTSSAPMVASPASEPALASSLPAQGGGTLPGAPADPRRKRIVLAAGALAMLALVSGIVAVTRQGATAAAASGSAPAVVETKP
ncbi:MAG TPA: protein kinase, partial [Labilithrix sp.]|nr:protein kinase [Labilithrix sp.]